MAFLYEQHYISVCCCCRVFCSLHIGGCAFYALARVKWIVHQIHVCLSVNNRKHWNFPIYLCTSKLTNNRRDTWNTKYTHTGTNTGALYICFFTYRHEIKGLLVLHSNVAFCPSAAVTFLGYVSTTCPWTNKRSGKMNEWTKKYEYANIGNKPPTFFEMQTIKR